MRPHLIRSLALGLVVSAPAWAQAEAAIENAAITRAIGQLDDESPAVRARARATILHAGEPALALLRSEVGAADDVAPELLFVIAEDIGRERRLARFTLHKDLGERSWQLAWRPDGQELALLRDYGGEVRIFDAELAATGERFGTVTPYFALDPMGKSCAYNDGAGVVVIAERESGRHVRIAVADKPGMVYSPDGQQLATGGYGRVVDLWSIADGTRLRQFAVDGPEGGLSPVFSPDGKLLVVGNRNGKTHVFDASSGEELHVLERRSTQQLAFSPDGKRLAIAYVDGKIGIWDPATGTLDKLLDSQAEEVFTLAWSPDGKLLASAGLSGPIVIWSGKHLAKLTTLESGSERTFRLAFRPDGSMLAAAGNQTTRIWRVETGR